MCQTKQVSCCILCHSIALGVHVLGSKNWGRKILISYKIENEISIMKKDCEAEYFDI
jgi:hypothetical protein